MKITPFARFIAGVAVDLTKHIRVNLTRRGGSVSLRDGKGRSMFNTRTRRATARIGGFTISRRLR